MVRDIRLEVLYVDKKLIIWQHYRKLCAPVVPDQREISTFGIQKYKFLYLKRIYYINFVYQQNKMINMDVSPGRNHGRRYLSAFQGVSTSLRTSRLVIFTKTSGFLRDVGTLGSVPKVQLSASRTRRSSYSLIQREGSCILIY